MFCVPRAGDWTVTAEAGEDSDSTLIKVNEKKAYAAALSFGLKVLSDGRTAEEAGAFTPVAGCTMENGCISATMDGAEGNYGYFAGALDITAYSKMTVEIYIAEIKSEKPVLVGVSSVVPATGNYIDNENIFAARLELKVNSQATEYELDLSNVNGEKYISIVAVGSFEISKIVLTK